MGLSRPTKNYIGKNEKRVLFRRKPLKRSFSADRVRGVRRGNATRVSWTARECRPMFSVHVETQLAGRFQHCEPGKSVSAYSPAFWSSSLPPVSTSALRACTRVRSTFREVPQSRRATARTQDQRRVQPKVPEHLWGKYHFAREGCGTRKQLSALASLLARHLVALPKLWPCRYVTIGSTANAPERTTQWHGDMVSNVGYAVPVAAQWIEARAQIARTASVDSSQQGLLASSVSSGRVVKTAATPLDGFTGRFYRLA